MFAILLFGGVMGFAGMVIGVPLFAVLYSVLTEKINHLLKKRGLSVDTNDYRGHKRIDPETHAFVEAQETTPPVSAKERRRAAQQKNQETAEQVSQIEQAILEHMDEIKQLLKQSDDFTHKENVKVYRNVQAVVVDEVKKQTEAIAAQNDELVRRNEHLQKQGRGLRPLMIITLVTALANIVLAAAQIAGLF